MRRYNTGYIGYIPMSADLIHIGHVHALYKAKKYCSFLIIGLLTDNAIKKYKGETPIISYQERLFMLRALEITDKVVFQQSLNMYNNLIKYKVNVVFTGDKWASVELKAIEKAGCVPIDFGYYKDQSTTKIKNKIIKLYGKNYCKK